MADETRIVPVERIERKIYFLRGQKVMLDQDLLNCTGLKLGY